MWVKVYDAIEAKGIDAFIASGKENLKGLNVQPHPGMFAQVADAMDAANDYTNLAKWLEFAGSLYPEETFLIMLRGDSQLKIGNKEAAKSLYQTAKEISVKQNDQRLANMIDARLKLL
jgi:hypothetical protein